MNIKVLREEILSMPFVSPTRVPYTYHHDYVRSVIGGGISRGDVGRAVRESEDETLYAGALLYLFKYHPTELLEFYQQRTWNIYMWARSAFEMPTIPEPTEICDPPCSECGHGYGYGEMLTTNVCPITRLLCPKKVKKD